MSEEVAAAEAGSVARPAVDVARPAVDVARPAVDVVIVGAGPTGLMLAIELCLAGVRPVVLERLTAISEIPKGNGLVGHIVPALDHRGLLERLRADATYAGPVPRFSFGPLRLELSAAGRQPAACAGHTAAPAGTAARGPAGRARRPRAPRPRADWAGPGGRSRRTDGARSGRSVSSSRPATQWAATARTAWSAS